MSIYVGHIKERHQNLSSLARINAVLLKKDLPTIEIPLRAGEPKPIKMYWFRDSNEPIEARYWWLAYVVGPFKTVRAARWFIRFGSNNPHCRCVADAERLSR